MPDAAIEIRDLGKSYKRGLFREKKKALRGVTFTVNMGEVFGFLGPNGAGKTTTIKVLLTFIRPDSGEIRILGGDGADPAIRRRIGFLPETANYYPYLTAHQTLTMYARLCRLSRSQQQKRIPALLKLVGLDLAANDKLSTFSKGMMQRIGIAGSLIGEPELMILDEPASGLDPLGKKEIRDLILKLKAKGKTVFFSSHELSEVETVCDRAAIIHRGRIVRQGTLAELLPYGDRYRVTASGLSEEKLKKIEDAIERTEKVSPEETYFITKAGTDAAELATRVKAAGGELLRIDRQRQSLEDAFLEIIRKEEAKGL